jgi:ubiquinone/menaquinone biosynthesis C-methylase UbiE
LLALYIANVVKPSPSCRILDIAPNISTSYIFDKKQYPNYVSIDLDSFAAEIHMDLTNLGIRNDTIDLIICYHVLEHIKDDAKSMQELCRILKPRGTAIL